MFRSYRHHRHMLDNMAHDRDRILLYLTFDLVVGR